MAQHARRATIHYFQVAEKETVFAGRGGFA